MKRKKLFLAVCLPLFGTVLALSGCANDDPVVSRRSSSSYYWSPYVETTSSNSSRETTSYWPSSSSSSQSTASTKESTIAYFMRNGVLNNGEYEIADRRVVSGMVYYTEVTYNPSSDRFATYANIYSETEWELSFAGIQKWTWGSFTNNKPMGFLFYYYSGKNYEISWIYTVNYGTYPNYTITQAQVYKNDLGVSGDTMDQYANLGGQAVAYALDNLVYVWQSACPLGKLW